MKKVEISYNPYLEQAGLRVDGQKFDDKAGRIGEFLVGKAMESWLGWKVISYRRWEGILPELIEFLNDDELNLIFCGLEEDFLTVRREMETQRRSVEEKGFDAGLYRLSFVEKWNPEKVRKSLQGFIRNRVEFAPTQKTMLEMEYKGRELEESRACTVVTLRRVKQELERTVHEIIENCRDEKYRQFWDNARRELEQIYS